LGRHLSGKTATNYQIYPGDRIYIAEDREITRTNLISKKTAPIERIMGILGITANTIRGLNNAPDADKVVSELVRKGIITDDEELKKIILDAIRGHNEQGKKAAGKAEEKR
jgi:hypothetical protein